ncbi:hypothetical protein [Arenimonas caeni]|jgi:hypothetical protein|uniref:hypothetical protein n=1 Tax=Arenimonas caeni TaxID=2058085 RepID=UPI002A35C62C|nr:hypothetical protein [Arenimonas caeni]MDY0021585.1 hypothetical protein [Arenimonas caeni]
MHLKKLLRTACLSAAVLFGASALAPAGEGLVGTAQANTVCTLMYTYIDEYGVEWGVYRCGPGPGNVIQRSCDRGCPWQVWDFREEQ